jgi:hypothetical protein
MKNKLILIILFFIQFTSFSQDLERIVDNTKKWNIIFGSYPPFGGNSYWTNSYTIGGDTLITEKLYSKIYIDNSFQYEYIREDENNNVYYASDYSEEYLIYNFNLNAGDEITLKNMWGYEYIWTVENVETIYFAEKNRKRITLFLDEGGLRNYWIEGIGSTLGLLFSGNFAYDFSTDLLCFYQNDEMLYSNPDWSSCNVSVSIAENKYKFNVFPNPTNDYINIETTEQIESLTIYDLTGRVIKSENTKIVDLSMLKAGIYFLNIKTNNDNFTKTIIKN